MKKSGKKESIWTVILVGVLAVASVVLLVVFRDSKESTKYDFSADAVKIELPSRQGEKNIKRTISIETIREGLENMGVLVTQEYYFTQIERYNKTKNVAFIFTATSEFTYSYDGAVTAGIDFGKIGMMKDEDTKTITVFIPKSEIMDVTVDKSTFKIFSEKESIWNPIKLDDYNTSLDEFEKTAKEKALQSGILDRADEQAKKLVSNFIGNYPNISDYKIEFR